MKTMQEAAQAANTILITARNKQPSLEWLRSVGIDAPDMSGRCLHLSRRQ